VNVIVITDPKQIQKDGKPLSWREWITDLRFAEPELKMHQDAGRKIEKYDFKKHGHLD
jgi:hypothetical protein